MVILQPFVWSTTGKHILFNLFPLFDFSKESLIKARKAIITAIEMFELVKCRPKLIGVMLTQIRKFTFLKYHSHIRSFTYLLALALILQGKITFSETNSHY